MALDTASSWQFYKVVHSSSVPCLLVIPEDHTFATVQALEPEMKPTDTQWRVCGPQILIWVQLQTIQK